MDAATCKPNSPSSSRRSTTTCSVAGQGWDFVPGSRRGGTHVRSALGYGAHRDSRWPLFLRQVREGDESRISALLHLIHTAVTTDPSSTLQAGNATGIELVLSEADRDASPNDAVWAISKRIDEPKSKGTWLLPDFGFAGWPETGIASFDEFLHLAQLQDQLAPWATRGIRSCGAAWPMAIRLGWICSTYGSAQGRGCRGMGGREADELPRCRRRIPPAHPHARALPTQVPGADRGQQLLGSRQVPLVVPQCHRRAPHAVDAALPPGLNADPTSRAQNFIELPRPALQRPGRDDATVAKYGGDSDEQDLQTTQGVAVRSG